MRKNILVIAALVISVITHAQITIQPADLKGAGRSVEISFTVKGNVIQAYSVGGSPESRPVEQLSLNFLDNSRNLMEEEGIIYTIVSQSNSIAYPLKAAGKDKFVIPKGLSAGNYNFLLNGKLIATNYMMN